MKVSKGLFYGIKIIIITKMLNKIISDIKKAKKSVERMAEVGR